MEEENVGPTESMDDLANDLGVEKEAFAAMVAPVPEGIYDACFMGLRRNPVKKGFVFPTNSGGLKIIPSFQIQGTGDPAIDGRFVGDNVSTKMKVFAQLDKALDLITGSRIDPEKVEAAIRKMVRVKVTIDDEYDPDNPKNKIGAIYPYREQK